MIQSSEVLGVVGGRRCRLLVMDDVRDWPETTPVTSRRFVLFIALTKPDPRDPVLHRAIERMIDHGCVGVTAFGPDSTHIDDLFDETVVGREVMEPEILRDWVLTCWYEETEPENTVEQALSFTSFECLVPEESREGCDESVIAVVGRPDLEGRVRAWCGANVTP